MRENVDGTDTTRWVMDGRSDGTYNRNGTSDGPFTSGNYQGGAMGWNSLSGYKTP